MTLWAAYALAALLGGAVGAVEIFQRYRAEPFPALVNGWGITYVAFNAGMAVAAFWVTTQVAGLGASSTALALVQGASVAGFGSSVVLRSKLLDVKLAEGQQVAVGPEIVIQTFLGVLDRELDRVRGRRRFETVRKLLTGIDFDRAKLRLPLQVFQALQSVSEEETQKLMQRIAEVDEMTTLDSQDKSYLLGFYLLDLVGEDFLADVLGKYKSDFGALPAAAADPDDGGAG